MRILATGAWPSAKENMAALEEMGHEVLFMQQEADSLPCSGDWPEAVIGNGLFLHHPIEEFRSLRYIQLTSAGFDRVPMEYVKLHDIEIHNAGGVYCIPMAEFALGGVLALYKQFRYFDKNRNEHRWKKNRDLLELFGKRVLILGCGSVGSACARLFKAFGCTVAGINHGQSASDIKTIGSVRNAEETLTRPGAISSNENFDSILGQKALIGELEIADLLILALPLTEETRHLIGEKELAAMKRNALLVNVSRGGIIDERALIEALEKDRIAGAVLDVYEEEPLARSSPLWDMDNVLVSPHNSFVGEGNRQRLDTVIIENCRKMT